MISLENAIRNRLRKCRLGKHPEWLREKTNTTLGLGTTAISTRDKKKTHLEKCKQIYQIEKYVNFLIFCRIIQLCPKRAKWTEVSMSLAVPVQLQRAAWGTRRQLSSTVSKGALGETAMLIVAFTTEYLANTGNKMQLQFYISFCSLLPTLELLRGGPASQHNTEELRDANCQ